MRNLANPLEPGNKPLTSHNILAILWQIKFVKKLGKHVLEFFVVDYSDNSKWGSATKTIQKRLPSGDGKTEDGIPGTIEALVNTLVREITKEEVGKKILVEKKNIRIFDWYRKKDQDYPEMEHLKACFQFNIFQDLGGRKKSFSGFDPLEAETSAPFLMEAYNLVSELIKYPNLHAHRHFMFNFLEYLLASDVFKQKYADDIKFARDLQWCLMNLKQELDKQKAKKQSKPNDETTKLVDYIREAKGH